MIGAAIAKGLRPEPRLTVSEWAAQYRILSPEASAEHGPWRNERAPYLVEIMDHLSSKSQVKELITMKGAQLGFTEAGNNWIGYVMDVAPGPILYLMPTDETVRTNSRQRIAPMIENCPSLLGKIGMAKSRSGTNNLTQKSFPGGTLIMRGANSAVGLRSMPIRYLFLDEVDGYPKNVDGEGSPVGLAEARAQTFSRRKIYKISTPKMKASSMIYQEYLNTDQRKYFVPCPHCDEYQQLDFENLKWDPGKYKTVRYYCPHCGAGIEERFKTKMMAAGEWRPTAPENIRVDRVGYHINSLYSPFGWLSWAEIAEKFEKAEKDRELKILFTNTILGEPYEEEGESPPWENIYNRREPYERNQVPDSVCFLTAGVDVQANRLELEITGWAPIKQSYLIDYRVFVGDTKKPDVWLQLREVMNEMWTREDGITMGIRMMCVDSGYLASTVYDFCRLYGEGRMVPVKGMDNLNLPLGTPKQQNIARNGKRVGNVILWPVGSGYLKGELYSYLALEQNEDDTFPSGYCHFPHDLDRDYFKGLTSERLVKETNRRGVTKLVWVRETGIRNEPLDCRNYSRAAASILQIERMDENYYKALAAQGFQNIRDKKSTSQKPKKKRRRSDFWE